MDIGKVIKGLETIKQFFGYGLPSTAEMFDSYYGILNDAIALLKEQEAKPVADIADSAVDGMEVGRCPSCDRAIVNKKSYPTRYCKFCGQEVKWNA